MRFGRIVEWDAVVFPSWQRAATVPRPNYDIWSVLPSNVLWFEAEIERDDIDCMYVIGSTDWKDAYGTYRLSQLSIAPFTGKTDPANHRARIQHALQNIDASRALEPPIVVVNAKQGPFVIIEGNHRAVAFSMRAILSGKNAYVGYHERMASEFPWLRSALPRKQTVRVSSKPSEK